MVRLFRFFRPVPAATLAACLGGLALAQSVPPVGVDCDALRQQLAAATQPDTNRAARFAQAIGQQRAELARTQAYGEGIGCGGLNLFGAPAECDAIENRINRQQTNLDTLEQQARLIRNGDPDRINDLSARYDAACRTPADANAALYADPGLVDGNGNASIMTDDGAETRPQGGGKAVCVRTCDGGFFPLGASARNASLDGLQALCSAQCPNTEAKLYTTADTDNIAAAVALDGSPYSALPAAFKYQKSHDAACTCKPPGQSWVQALAKAEDLLDKTDTHDVTVTEKMSAEMARPTAPAAPAPPAVKKTAKRRTNADRNGLDLPPPALPEPARVGTVATRTQAVRDDTGLAGDDQADGVAAPPVMRRGRTFVPVP